MGAVVYPWIALQLTGSPAWVGLILGVPAIIAFGPTLVGGWLSDAWSKRNVLFTTRLSVAIAALLTAVLVDADSASIWILFSLLVVAKVSTGVGFPADRTILADVVDGPRITSASALRSMVDEATDVIGAGVGGVTLAAFGATGAFISLALIYSGSAFLIVLVQPDSWPRQTGDGTQQIGYAAALAEIRRNRLLLALAGITLVDFFSAFLIPLLAVHAEAVLGAEARGFGLIMVSLAVGGVIGGGLVASVGDGLRSSQAILIGNLGWGLGMAGIAVSEHFHLTVAIVLGTGLFGAVAGIGWSSLALRAMPAAARGKLFGLFNIGFQFYFLGVVAAGFLATAVGVQATLWAGALGVAALTIGIWATSSALRTSQPPAGRQEQCDVRESEGHDIPG